LNDKIKFVKKVLKTPYHFFSLTSNRLVEVILEDKQGKRFTFVGNTISNSIETAEEYIKHEIQAGAIKDPNQNLKVKDKK